MIYNPVNPSQQLTPKQGPRDQSPSRAADHPPDGKGGEEEKEEGFLVGEMLAHLGAAAVKMKVPV